MAGMERVKNKGKVLAGLIGALIGLALGLLLTACDEEAAKCKISDTVKFTPAEIETVAEPEEAWPVGAVLTYTPEEAEALLDRFAEEREAAARAEREAEEKRRAAAQTHYAASTGDAWMLAVIIGQETAGISDDMMMAVGNVVLNRVADSRFPGTVYGVLTSPGQYGRESGAFYFNDYVSSAARERCLNAAQRLLAGERVLPANVVWQAGYPQGAGTYMYYNAGPHGMYLCY